MSNQKSGYFLFISRTCSLFLALTLSVPGGIALPLQLYAQPQNSHGGITGTPSAKSPASAKMHEIVIPPSFGHIDEKFQGAGSEAVFIIQDAHAIPDAQNSIVKLIEHLHAEYGVDTAALEGADGELDAEFFRTYPDAGQFKESIMKLIGEGELSAGAAAALLVSDKLHFVGVENDSLYREGISALLRGLSAQPGYLEKFDQLKDDLNRIKSKHYSAQAAQFDAVLENYETHQKNLLDFLQGLEPFNVEYAGRPLLGAVSQWVKEKKDGPSNAINQKVLKLAEIFKLRLTDPARIQEFQNAYQDWRTERASAGDFLFRMSSLDADLPMDESLKSYAEMHKKIQNMRGWQLDREIQSVVAEIKSRVFLTPDERVLGRAAERMKRLGKLLNFELSRPDWQELQGEVSDHNGNLSQEVQNVLSRIRDFQLEISRQGADFENFYRIAVRRETVFQERLKSLMAQSRSKRVIFLAGGFHLQGIAESLKQAGISLAVISPKIQNLPERSSYLARMQGRVRWSRYFIEKDNEISISEAFTRGLRDELIHGSVSGSEVPLKPWRDSMIRHLASQNRLTESSKYTRYLDEVIEAQMTDDKLAEIKEEWSGKLDRFLSGLKILEREHNLNEQSVGNLMGQAMSVTPYDVMPLGRKGVRIPSWWVFPKSRLVPAGSSRSEVRTLPEEIENKIRFEFPVPLVKANGETRTRVRIEDPALLNQVDFFVHWGRAGETQAAAWHSDPVSPSEITPGVYELRTTITPEFTGEYGATFYARLKESTAEEDSIWQGHFGQDSRWIVDDVLTRKSIRLQKRPEIESFSDSGMAVLNFQIDPKSFPNTDWYIHWGPAGADDASWTTEKISPELITDHGKGDYSIRKFIQPAAKGYYGVTFYAQAHGSDEKLWIGRPTVDDTVLHAYLSMQEKESIQASFESFDAFKAKVNDLVHGQGVRGIGKVIFDATKENSGARQKVGEYLSQASALLQSFSGTAEGKKEIETVYYALLTLGIGELIFVAPEGPHAFGGGLAKVIIELTEVLAQYGIFITVITPFYEEAHPEGKHKSAEGRLLEGLKINGKMIPIQPVADGDLSVAMGPVYASGTKNIREPASTVNADVYKAEDGRVRYYFIRNPEFFDVIYAPTDTKGRLKRAILLSRAALEMTRDPRFKIGAGTILSHDWMAGLIHQFLRTDETYLKDPVLKQFLAGHMIHNYGKDYQAREFVNQQGEDLWPLLGISDEHFFGFSDPNDQSYFNITASALRHVDRALLTVSLRYAEELLTVQDGEGLHELLNRVRKIFYGISNGIALDSTRRLYRRAGEEALQELGRTPLAEQYSEETYLQHLEDYKEAVLESIQKRYKLAINPNAKLLSLGGRLAEQKGIQLFDEDIDGLTVMERMLLEDPDVQILIGGPAADHDEAAIRLEKVMRKLIKKYPGRVQNIANKTPSLEEKQKRYGLKVNPDAHLQILGGPEAGEQGSELFAETVDGIPVLVQTLMENPNAQILIDGDAADANPDSMRLMVEKYPGRIQSMNAEKLFGFVDNKELLRIILASRFFLMPSRFEPGGLTQLEALAAGTLVIGRDIGGIASTIVDYFKNPADANGFLFKEFTGRAFFEGFKAAVQAVADPAVRDHMVGNAATSKNDWGDHRIPLFFALLQNISGVINPEYPYPHFGHLPDLIESIHAQAPRSEVRSEEPADSLSREDRRRLRVLVEEKQDQAFEILRARGLADKAFHKFYWDIMESLSPRYVARPEYTPEVLADRIQRMHEAYRELVDLETPVTVRQRNLLPALAPSVTEAFGRTEFILAAMDRVGLDNTITTPIRAIGANIDEDQTIKIPHPDDPKKLIDLFLFELSIDRASLPDNQSASLEKTILSAQEEATTRLKEVRLKGDSNRPGVYRGRAAILKSYPGGIKDVAYDIYASIDELLSPVDRAKQRAKIRREDIEKFETTLDHIAEQIRELPGTFNIPENDSAAIVAFMENARRYILDLEERNFRDHQEGKTERFSSLSVFLSYLKEARRPRPLTAEILRGIERHFIREHRGRKHLYTDELDLDEQKRVIAKEIEEFRAAVMAVLEPMRANATGPVVGVIRLVEGRGEIMDQISARIQSESEMAEDAIMEIVPEELEKLRSLGERMANNARDIESIFTRVYRLLDAKKKIRGEQYQGVKDQILRELSGDILFARTEETGSTVLFAHDMDIFTAFHIKQEFPDMVAVVADEGTVGSHWAQWLSDNSKIAVVIAPKNSLREILHEDLISSEVIVDGTMGEVYINPDQQQKELYEKVAEIERAFQVVAKRHAGEEAKTGFGKVLGISGSADSPEQISEAIENGATSIGLVRTEYLFRGNILDAYIRNPNEANRKDLIEYFKAQFVDRIRAAQGRPITLRMYDFERDKDFGLPNPYKQYGPAYYRTRLGRELLKIELIAAILADAEVDGSQARILFPMYRSPRDLAGYLKKKSLKKLKSELQKKLNRLALEDLNFADQMMDESLADAVKLSNKTSLKIRNVPRGIMIETRETMNILPTIVQKMDFVSVGTTDFTISQNRELSLDVSRDNAQYSQLFTRLQLNFRESIRQILETVSTLNEQFKAAGSDKVFAVGLCGVVCNANSLLIYLSRYAPDNVPLTIARSAGRIADTKQYVRAIKSEDANVFDRTDVPEVELQTALDEMDARLYNDLLRDDEVVKASEELKTLESQASVVEDESHSETVRIKLDAETRQPQVVEVPDSSSKEPKSITSTSVITQARIYRIGGVNGLHTDPSSDLLKIKQLPGNEGLVVHITKEGREKILIEKIMDSLMLGAQEGEVVTVELTGTEDQIRETFTKIEAIKGKLNFKSEDMTPVFAPVEGGSRAEVRAAPVYEDILAGLYDVRPVTGENLSRFTQVVSRKTVAGAAPEIRDSFEKSFNLLVRESQSGRSGAVYGRAAEFENRHSDYSDRRSRFSKDVTRIANSVSRKYLRSRVNDKDAGLNFAFAFPVVPGVDPLITEELLRYIRMVRALKRDFPGKVKENILIAITAEVAGDLDYSNFIREINASGVARTLTITNPAQAHELEWYLDDNPNALVYGFSEFPVALQVNKKYRSRFVSEQVPLKAVLPVALLITPKIARASHISAALLERIPDILPGMLEYNGVSLVVSSLALSLIYDYKVRTLIARMA